MPVTDQQKNARYALAVLFGINLMNFFDRQIAGALLEPIRLEFGMNDTAIGWVNTAFTLVYAVVGVPLGRLTDSWKRTELIAIGVSFWSVLTAASGLAVGYWSYLLTRIGRRHRRSELRARQSITDRRHVSRRSAARARWAIFMMGLPLGLFAAYILSGIIGEAWGWRAAFFVACVPGLILAVLALLIREPARGAVGSAGSAGRGHWPLSVRRQCSASRRSGGSSSPACCSTFTRMPSTFSRTRSCNASTSSASPTRASSPQCRLGSPVRSDC